MQLRLNPENGQPFADAEKIAGWRLTLAQPTGKPGRPRVVKGPDGDPLNIAPDATEEQVAQLIVELGLDVAELRVVCRAYDAREQFMFEREVDIVVDDDGGGRLQPSSIAEEALQGMAAQLVESNKVLASAVDRLAVSNESLAAALAGRGSDDDERPPSVWDKLLSLVGDDGVAAVKEELRKQREAKEKTERDVTPTPKKGE